MLSKIVLVAMLLAELLGSAYGISRYVAALGSAMATDWLALPTILLGALLPVTVVFLVSLCSETNEAGELLPDSMVARIAMFLSEEVKRTGEFNICPTYWQAALALATVEALGFLCGYGLSLYWTSSAAVNAMLISGAVTVAEWVIGAVGYIFLAVGVTRGLGAYVKWSTGGEDDGAPAIAFFVMCFVLIPINAWTTGLDYVHPWQASIASVGGMFYIVAWLCYLFGVGKAGVKKVYNNSGVGAWIKALLQKSCQKMKIAKR